MKGSLTVVAFFCAGCLMGVANDFQFDLHDLSMYVLYALMFQVGIGIGSNKKLKELVKSGPKCFWCRWPPLWERCCSLPSPVCC